jgi:dephospho-CoA kinase
LYEDFKKSKYMPNSDKKFVQKLENVAHLASQSEAMQNVLALSESQWLGVLSDLDEKKLDELVFALKEEKEGYEAIEKKRLRQHQINSTRRLQRLERLSIRMEEITKNAKKND